MPEYLFPADAVCRPENGFDEDPDLFFPVGEPGFPLYDAQVDEARAYCALCPVRAECLDYAVDHNIRHGVYGGLDAHERADLVATPADVLFARHAAENARREVERRAQIDARLRAAARPLNVKGRAATRPRRPRTGGTCPVCGESTWVRVKTGGMTSHRDRPYGGACDGIDQRPRSDRPIYTEGTR